jgi:hypothetical protein
MYSQIFIIKITILLASQPWTAIPFDKLNFVQTLGAKFEIQGYPTFMILKAEDGSLVDMEGREAVAGAKGNTSKCLTKWGK